VYSNSNDAKRQRQQPHDGVEHQSKQRDRPAQNKQNDPQEKSCHGNLANFDRGAISLVGGYSAAGTHIIVRESAPRSFLNGVVVEPQALSYGRWNLRIQTHVGVVDFGGKDAPKRVNQSQSSPFCQREPDR
jgi:hypothetical protein